MKKFATRNVQSDTRQAGSPSDKPFMGDVKVTVPGTSSKESRKRKSKQHVNVNQEKIQPDYPSHHLDDGSSRSTVSSADAAVSTTASTSHPWNGNNHNRQTEVYSQDRNGNAKDQGSPGFGETSFDEDFAHGSETAFASGTPRGEQKYQQMRSQMSANQVHTTIAQTRIKGDSYPPTSAGAPSITDQPEMGKAGHYAMPTHAIERPSFGRPQFIKPTDRHRPPLTTNSPERGASLSHRDAKPLHLPSEPDAPINDPPTAFAFPANTSRKSLTLHPAHKVRSPMSPRPLSPVNQDHAQLLHEDPGRRTLQQVIPATTGNTIPTKGQELPRALAQDETEGRGYQQANTKSDRQYRMADEAPASDTYTEYEQGEQGEHQPFDNALDYDASELYKKDFRSLQAESFDQGPNAEPFKKVDMPESATLTDKVAHLVAAEPAVQAEFFASLGVDDWEEAGDWFLEQFGQTVGRLKNLRREKRKAALSFEDEVRARDEAIVKKRKITEVAMGEMKTSGAAVLMGTPGKGK